MSHEIRTPINAVLGMDEMNLKVFLGLLKNHGMQIDTAMSGKECLALVEKMHIT